MTARKEIVEIIREMPGVTSGQIIELMPHVNSQSVHSALNYLYVRGIAVRELDGETKFGRKPFTWKLADKPIPPIRKAPATMARRADAQVDGLKRRVAELEEWKAQAIRRFPDLGVDPVILRARQIVAAELRTTNDSSDRASAEAVLAGQRDNVLAVRLVVKMLEEKAA